MATGTFHLTATVDAPPERVIEFLLQLDGHRRLHPYLQSARVVDEGADGDERWCDWRVVERPRLWGIPYTMSFPARMTRVNATSMRGDVVAAPGCRLRTVTTATTTGAGTVVEEIAEVIAPRLLVGYMTKHARLAHARTFSLLPAQFASAQPG